MREVTFERNYLLHPDGSCLASFGNTKVICTASIEQTVPPFLEDSGRGWITAEYSMLPGSTPGGRKRRESLKPDGRSTEIRRLVGRSLRSAVDLKKLGSITIIIDCDVIQADGGTRTAAISGGWVALYDALRKVAQVRATPEYETPESGPSNRGTADRGAAGQVTAARDSTVRDVTVRDATNRDPADRDPAAAEQYLLGQVAAVSVGIVGGEIVCDLDYDHDSRAEVDMNVVKRDNSLVEVQGTGEKDTFTREQLQKLLDAADEGIATIFERQRKALDIC